MSIPIIGLVSPLRGKNNMVSPESNPSGAFNDFTAKAFVIALAKFEGTLSPSLVAEINDVGKAVINGQLSQIADLENIAKKDRAFYDVYENAYMDLQDLAESEEKNKYLGELTDNEPSRKSEGDDYTNFLAPLLAENNPQSAVKKLLASASNVVNWVYKLKPDS